MDWSISFITCWNFPIRASPLATRTTLDSCTGVLGTERYPFHQVCYGYFLESEHSSSSLPLGLGVPIAMWVSKRLTGTGFCKRNQISSIVLKIESIGWTFNDLPQFLDCPNSNTREHVDSRDVTEEDPEELEFLVEERGMNDDLDDKISAVVLFILRTLFRIIFAGFPYQLFHRQILCPGNFTEIEACLDSLPEEQVPPTSWCTLVARTKNARLWPGVSMSKFYISSRSRTFATALRPWCWSYDRNLLLVSSNLHHLLWIIKLCDIPPANNYITSPNCLLVNFKTVSPSILRKHQIKNDKIRLVIRNCINVNLFLHPLTPPPQILLA